MTYLIILMISTSASAQMMLQNVGYEFEVIHNEKMVCNEQRICHDEIIPIKIKVDKGFVCQDGSFFNPKSDKKHPRNTCKIMRMAPPEEKVRETNSKDFADFVMAVRKCLFAMDSKCLAEHVGHPERMFFGRKDENIAYFDSRYRNGASRYCKPQKVKGSFVYFKPKDYADCVYKFVEKNL